ncbi:MAG: GNAT family N-acetyltransferase, partial [Gaiellaceae bacterium]
ALREAGADPAVWRYMPVDASVDDGAFHAWIETALADPGRVPFAILREGVPVGSSSYLSLVPEHRRLEIGYTWVGRDCWGSGVNTEAKLLLLEHAFERCGALRVEFKTDASNERSRAALAGLPASFEGVHRRHMLVQGGRRRDSAWYSVIDEDWPAVRARLEEKLGR